tara:strand:- start:170 stop:1324 length:1155 start_codon:yes stop_codon:yes gene_type:complete
MVKILVVSDTFYPRMDGIIRFITELNKRIDKKYKLKFLIPKLKDSQYFVKKYNFDVSYCPTYNFSIAEFKPGKPVKKIITDEIKNSDIVFVNTPGGPIGASSIYRSKKLAKPVLGYAHTIDWELFPVFGDAFNLFNKPIKLKSKSISRLINPILKRNYNKLDYIIYPNELIKRKYENFGIKVKSKILPLGVDKKKFKKNYIDKLKIKKELNLKKEYIFGYHGRLSKEKNIKLIIDSFNELNKKYKNSKLILMGDGPERELINDNKDIIFLGKIENPERYLNIVDCYMLLSETETSSLSLMEIIQMSIPFITTKLGILNDNISKQNYVELTSSQLKPKIISKYMEKVMKNKFQSKFKSALTKQQAKIKDWDEIISQLEDIFLKFE